MPNTIVDTITVGSNPTKVAIAPNGKRVYVTNRDENSVSVIDTTKIPNTVINTITLGGVPNGAAVSPDGKRLFVATGTTVSVVDTTKTPNIVVDTVATPRLGYGGSAYDVVVSPDGKRVYVKETGGTARTVLFAVQVLDVTTTPITLLDRINVGGCSGGSPCLPTDSLGMVVAPDGKHLYVTVFYKDTNPAIKLTTSLVQVIDTTVTPNTIIDNLSLPDGSNPGALTIASDGKRLYAANYSSNNVSVIDITKTPNIVVDTVPVGINPNGAAVTPDGKHVYVTNLFDKTVSVIDTTKTPDTVVNTIDVGFFPSSVEIQQSPSNKDQCTNGGWNDFHFKNQGQCIKFINTGK